MKLNKIVVLTGLIFLFAFAPTKGNAFLDKLKFNQSVEKPAWHNEKLVTCDECNSITYDNVKSFVDAYYREEEKQSMSSNDEAAGQELMQSYTMASLLINRSQLCLAQALKLKEVTDDLLKEKAILLCGTSLSKKEIKKHREYSKEASQKIISTTRKTSTLTKEQRKNFSLGTATYLTGTYMTQKTAKDVAKYIQVIADNISNDSTAVTDSNITNILNKGASMLKLSGTAKAAGTLKNLSAGIDDHMLNLATTSKSIYQYSRKQNLKLPADASQYVNFN